MARQAEADGLTHLFATPHHRDYTPLPRLEVIEQVAAVQTELDRAKIALTVIPGHEVRLYNDMFDDWAKELAGPLGQSRYVLAEPLFSHYDKHTDAMLFELFERGYIPVMAHPERIRPIQENLALIEPFLKRGGLTQITATSLTGNQEWRARQTAETMLRQGLVHVIASDAHHSYHRTPTLMAARNAAAKIVGSTEAEMMVYTRPLAMVNDKPMPETVVQVQYQ
jgi:protein-tyrosine phosphatase